MLGMVPVPAEVGTLALFFGQSGNLSINYTVMLSLHEPIFLKQNHVFIFNIAQKVKYINLNCEMIIHLANFSQKVKPVSNGFTHLHWENVTVDWQK